MVWGRPVRLEVLRRHLDEAAALLEVEKARRPSMRLFDFNYTVVRAWPSLLSASFMAKRQVGAQVQLYQGARVLGSLSRLADVPTWFLMTVIETVYIKVLWNIANGTAVRTRLPLSCVGHLSPLDDRPPTPSSRVQ